MNVLSTAPNELNSGMFKHFWTVHVNEILYSLLVYEINETAGGKAARDPPTQSAYASNWRQQLRPPCRPQDPRNQGRNSRHHCKAHPWLLTTVSSQAAQQSPSGSSLKREVKRGDQRHSKQFDLMIQIRRAEKGVLLEEGTVKINNGWRLGWKTEQKL